MDELANRYAGALFDLALESSKLDLFEDEVKLVLDTMKNDKDFECFKSPSNFRRTKT